MRLYRLIKARYTKEVVDSAYCNKCGDILFEDGYPDWINIHEFKVENGFGNKYDGQQHTFDLCDKCYVKIIKRFKHPVTFKSMDYL